MIFKGLASNTGLLRLVTLLPSISSLIPCRFLARFTRRYRDSAESRRIAMIQNQTAFSPLHLPVIAGDSRVGRAEGFFAP